MLNEGNTANPVQADCVRVKEDTMLGKDSVYQETSEEFDEYHSPFHDPRDDCDVCVLADQRMFYLYHRNKNSYWEPPSISWNCRLGLPYGWEEAIDAFGAQYFINHLSRTTTYEDPRQGASTSSTAMEPSQSDETRSSDLPETPPLRTYEIYRHPTIGFGFVAASQHPVIIQFVTLGGPSDGKLMANDQIIEVNGVDVSGQGKDEVVAMIRSSESPLILTVSQIPPKKKANRRRNCRVRFEDKVIISNGEMQDYLPMIPNVLRVFLENGQTKSFKYDQETCVQDVLNSLVEKLQIKNGNRFALASEQFICTRSPKLTLLRSDQLLSELASQPSAQSARCRFRLTFVPQDLREFLADDPDAFNYLYEQCVNDVVAGRFSYEMRYEACVRLAALHLRQVAIETNSLKPDGRASISRMEREYGLATFLPTILLENVKRKEIRKHLRFYLKKDDDEQSQTHCHQSPRSCTPMKKCSISEELPSFSVCSLIGDTNNIGQSLRLRYIQIVSNLPSFGGRCFSVTFKQTHIDMVMQIDSTQGLLVRHPGKLAQPTISIDYDLIHYLHVSPDTDVLRCITIRLQNTAQQGLEFLIDKDDIGDLILYISGYCKVLHDRDIRIEYSSEPADGFSIGHQAPPYEGTHFVYPAGWNYSTEMKDGIEVMANFAHGPPPYSQAIGATTFYEDNTTDTITVDCSERVVSPIRHSTCNGDEGGKKRSLDLPKYIDEPSPVDNSLEKLNTPEENPSRRRSKLLSVTDSLLVKKRKHVRFAENQAPPKPPRRSYSPPLYKVAKEESSTGKNGTGHALISNNNTIGNAFAAYCSGVTTHLPTSRTFPMADKDLDFGDDFVPRTYATAKQEWQSEEGQNKPQVRRMSLKEFTGLEPSNSRTKTSISPILARFHRTSFSTSGGGHLLDKFCIRRRSSSGIHRGPLSDLCETGEPPVTNRFGSALRPPSCEAPRLVHEPIDFNQVDQRLARMRSRLTSTMEGVPNESPRKRNTLDSEKGKMMEELSRLASGCKNMVRATTLTGQSEEQWRGILLDTVDSADGVTGIAENLLKKSNSVYQAQLMTSKVDQMLRALIETVHDMQKAYKAEPYGEEAKQLVRSSTTLAATLNQLIHSIQGL
ncbi:hypothetical protein FO519_000302 [Halicephalobus sp. NKZ332]|nr:hypothetical protein FO519_000302 [Halicephalobus sp. NKZ332]